MHYFFPKEWTLDGTEFRDNSALSPLDVKFIGTQYKKAAVPTA
jgi:hypothetical protein